MRKVATILFWIVMLAATVSLWRTVGEDWRGALRTALFVVPYVVFVSWLRSRFSGLRRRWATIMVFSAPFALLAGSITVWDLELLRSGFEGRSTSVEASVAGLLFLISILVFVWSLLRLLRGTNKVPI